MNINPIMEELIDKTFQVLQKVYNYQSEGNGEFSSKCGSRIVFPQYRENGKTRVSEQELRFVFVEQFNQIAQKKDLYYSVETPTKGTYSFSKKERPCADENGRSGEFDMTIFDQMRNRICLIEFKAHNVETKDFQKDLVKLENKEEGKDIETYFVLLLEGCDNDTIKSVKEKISEYKDRTHIKCFALKSDDSKVITL